MVLVASSECIMHGTLPNSLSPLNKLVMVYRAPDGSTIAFGFFVAWYLTPSLSRIVKSYEYVSLLLTAKRESVWSSDVSRTETRQWTHLCSGWQLSEISGKLIFAPCLVLVQTLQKCVGIIWSAEINAGKVLARKMCNFLMSNDKILVENTHTM